MPTLPLGDGHGRTNREIPMSNEEVYAAGLLNRALDPTLQPPEIRAWLRAELDELDAIIPHGASVIDVGCGTGRHLLGFRDRLVLGVGVDYERSYIVEARRRGGPGRVHFVTADATAIPLLGPFDFAICLTNTWGTMSDKAGVLREMRRVAPQLQRRIVTVYSEASVPVRRVWYPRLGHPVITETAEYLDCGGGFRSEHFSEDRLRRIIGECVIRPLAEIAYLVMF